MLEGHCLCGQTRFRINPPWLFVGHCHCDSCRRQTASAATTFIGVRDGHWSWLGEAPARYESSPGVRRWFCARCGAPAAFQDDKQPGETHFYAALLDTPEAVIPTEDYHAEEAISWCPAAPSTTSPFKAEKR